MKRAEIRVQFPKFTDAQLEPLIEFLAELLAQEYLKELTQEAEDDEKKEDDGF